MDLYKSVDEVIRLRLPRTRGDGPLSLTMVSKDTEAFPAHAGMDPRTRTRPHGPPGLPRTRGDGPVLDLPAQPAYQGFPAHAGMDPRAPRRSRSPAGLPRTRGDGPARGMVRVRWHEASPHTRGWTRWQWVAGLQAMGFPAHAGMDPGRAGSCRHRPRLPRTRGDGTHGARVARPRRRGFPAHAGMDPKGALLDLVAEGLPRTRGDGPGSRSLGDIAAVASPHTRGWTHTEPEVATRVRGFPAHAGMDPIGRRTQTRHSGLPRTTRGWTRLRGGVLPDEPGFPRTRGDGPLRLDWTGFATQASPHTRGWTRIGLAGPPCVQGFPAHAGMDPSISPRRPASGRLPRTRGDGPVMPKDYAETVQASPHTRGWTPERLGRSDERLGFPAHAGMDPSASHPAADGGGLPRTRGDGPFVGEGREALTQASPHTRGWTLRRLADHAVLGGFPAHAGMELLAVIERTPACRDRVASRKALINRGL